jgi:hypothetical protein
MSTTLIPQSVRGPSMQSSIIRWCTSCLSACRPQVTLLPETYDVLSALSWVEMYMVTVFWLLR